MQTGNNSVLLLPLWFRYQKGLFGSCSREHKLKKARKHKQDKYKGSIYSKVIPSSGQSGLCRPVCVGSEPLVGTESVGNKCLESGNAHYCTYEGEKSLVAAMLVLVSMCQPHDVSQLVAMNNLQELHLWLLFILEIQYSSCPFVMTSWNEAKIMYRQCTIFHENFLSFSQVTRPHSRHLCNGGSVLQLRNDFKLCSTYKTRNWTEKISICITYIYYVSGDY